MRNSFRFFALATGLSLLAACFNSQVPGSVSQQTTPANPMPGVLAAAKNLQASKPIVFDLGSKTSKAAFSFTIKPANGKLEESFKTKASASGHAQKTVSVDLDSYKVHLLDLANNPSQDQIFDATNTTVVRFSSGLIPYSTSTQTFTFKNVPASGAGGTQHYFVAIEAYEASTNITNDTPGTTDLSRIILDTNGASAGGLVYAYRTSGGGDNENSFAGGVIVDSNHDIAATQLDTLTATLTLWDELGATIDSNVTVSDGSASYNGGIVVE